MNKEAVLSGISNILPKIVSEGDGWPDNAMYKVRYRTKCWPCGYDDWTHVYLADTKELHKWLESYRSWAALEGNSVEYVIFEWMLGEQFLRDGFF